MIWVPGHSLRTFGFYPKFSNDNRQKIDSPSIVAKIYEFHDLFYVRLYQKVGEIKLSIGR